MTLIVATEKELLADDGIEGSYRHISHDKVLSVRGAVLGFAGDFGAICRTTRWLRSPPDDGPGLPDFLRQLCKGDDSSVSYLCLTKDGLFVGDSDGSYFRCVRGYAAVGSGAEAAMGILDYTDGQASLLDVLESVARIIPSVAPTGKVYTL